MRLWRRKTGAAVLLVAVLGATAACSGGSGEGNDSGGSGAASSAAGESRTSADSASGSFVDGTTDAPGKSGTAIDTDSTVISPRAPVSARAVISTGRVTLQAKDLTVARDDLDRMLGKYGGFVADEETYNDARGRTETSRLTLRVPSSRFADAMRDLDDLGRVQSRTSKTDDVTTEVIDVEARIRTEQVSLSRLRGFLSKAATVDAMIRLESEIARREANLASLQAQQRYLDDQTTLSTIVLTMVVPDAASPEPDRDPFEDAGFVTGLQNGWNALLDILLVVATVLGAVLPFGVVIALVGLPAYLWLRRHRSVAPPASQAPRAG